jgi:LysM repeat protein
MRTVVLLGVLIWCTNVLHANNRFDFDFDSDKARLYIEKYKHIAVAEMDRMGIPASIKMAQALLESGIGESKLAINANNHFGIKCGGEVWTGETYYMWDDEPVKSCFRVYETAEESFIAHSEFLRNPKKDFRYGVLFDLDKKDYEGWAKGLQKSGYATSKTYSKKLISLIERLELYKLDHLTSQTLALEEGELANIFPSLGPHPDIKDGDSTAIVVYIPDPFSSYGTDTVSIALTQKVFKINNLDAVYVQPNDVIGSIAKRYKIAEKRLIDYNEIYNKKDKKLKTGQYIYLQRKKNFYHHRNAKKDVETHIVRQGQSMYDIAQQYGIKICKLYRLNPAYHCSNPPSGVLIFLRKSKRKNK